MGILGKIFKSDDENSTAVGNEQVGKRKDVKKNIEKSENDKSEVVVEKIIGSGKKHGDPTAYKFLAQPLITEKATDLVALNKYCFIVPVSANKSEVAKRIKSVYGVKPVKVNFVKVFGKKVRTGRAYGQRKNYKKAIITLKKEDKIEIYEGV